MLKFILLGFTAKGACGLILRPDGSGKKSGGRYTRVGMLARFLPSDGHEASETVPDSAPGLTWWGDEREVVIIKRAFLYVIMICSVRFHG